MIHDYVALVRHFHANPKKAHLNLAKSKSVGIRVNSKILFYLICLFFGAARVALQYIAVANLRKTEEMTSIGPCPAIA